MIGTLNENRFELIPITYMAAREPDTIYIFPLLIFQYIYSTTREKVQSMSNYIK